MNKLMIAVMYSDEGLYLECKKELVELFGEIFFESEAYDFDKFTSYYSDEMGKGLVKRFIIFEKPIEKISLNDKSIKIKSIKKESLIKKNLKKIKFKTTEIEKKYSKDGKRQINLDPGYLSSSELVLASFKKGTNYKEDVGDGVYLHKVLEFEKDKVIMFWHTFPDYKENWEFFIENKLV